MQSAQLYKPGLVKGLIFTALFLIGGQAFAIGQREFVAIQNFLATQRAMDLDTDAQASMNADLNQDGKTEILLLWLLLGPTYSYARLTVLEQRDGEFVEAATAPLIGYPDGMAVHGDRILVRTLIQGEQDPRCCPSVSQSFEFRWVGKELKEQISAPLSNHSPDF